MRGSVDAGTQTFVNPRDGGNELVAIGRALPGVCRLVDMRWQQILNKLTGESPVVLELDLARGLIEHRPNNPLKALQLINATSMQALREKLHQAADDDSVRGLILHAVGAGPISLLEEVADLVEEFGESKPTIAWAESFGEMSSALPNYTLATAAKEIWLQPTGDLCIPGAELHITLLRGLFNKVGVEPQFGQRYEYKTAADQYAATEVTEANREMTQRLGQSIVEELVATIARRRGLTAEQVWDAVNQGYLTADQAEELGFVDHVGYRDQAYAAALEAWEAQPEQLRYLAHYKGKLDIPAILGKAHAPKVGQVTLRGPIVTGRGGSGGMGGPTAGSDVIDEQLRQALRDDKVKAVVFTIDSPGGSAVASDFIRRAVLRVKEADKPIVAQMGAVAASGGYYAAMACNEIVAHAATLTGSIGVLAGKLVTQGLFEKVGLQREPVRIGESAGVMSSVTEFSEADWAKLNEILDRIYKNFTSFAAEDRGMEYDQLESLARGRVWTGADAKKHDLIDHVGGWRDALERACALADLDVDHVNIERMGHPSLLERFVPAQSSESRSGEGVGVNLSVPDVEEIIAGGARLLGLPYDGALSLPHRIDIA